MRICHLARAANRRALVSLAIDEVALLVNMIVDVAWTEPNFCSDFIFLKRSIARSHRNGMNFDFGLRRGRGTLA